MKNFFLLFFSTVLIVSCQKETNVAEQPLPAQSLSNVAYGADAAQKMDLYLPAGRSRDSTKLIIFVHGGGWQEGDKADFNPHIAVLQQRLPSYAIANINYRLATAATNHFPVQEMDVKAALDFLVQKSGDYHFAQKFVLLGASAGGHLVTLQAYKYATPKIKAVVDFFGPIDMVELYNASSPQGQYGIQILMGGTPTTNPQSYAQSSPINFVSAQSPPTIIFHGGMDDLVNISQSITLKNKLQSVGVVTTLVTYPSEGHGWGNPSMDDSFNRLEAFLRANVQ